MRSILMLMVLVVPQFAIGETITEASIDGLACVVQRVGTENRIECTFDTVDSTGQKVRIGRRVDLTQMAPQTRSDLGLCVDLAWTEISRIYSLPIPTPAPTPAPTPGG